MNVKKIKNYLYALWCKRYQICTLQNDAAIKEPYYYDFNGLLKNKVCSPDRILHRTLLWDDCEPQSQMKYICSVRSHTRSIFHVMWNKKQIEKLVKKDGMDFYFDYTRKIQQADLARYIVLYQYGGMYLDFDVSMHCTSDEILIKTGVLMNNELSKEYCILSFYTIKISFVLIFLFLFYLV